MKTPQWPPLPKQARLPINRCNLPADILGSISFQQRPKPLLIDGIAELHHDLFKQLEVIEQPENRAHYFMDYMVVRFRLEMPEEIGFEETSKVDRRKANYQRVIKGWFFNPNSREAAVLKGWVESRFGLTPQYHHSVINDPTSDAYRRFSQERADGLYNTNALESQLDLLYSYCQYELHKQQPKQSHLKLYRGCNHIPRYHIDSENTNDGTSEVMLLNNINSFSTNAERADEFGDHVINVKVPFSKIVVTSNLLPGLLRGEEEILVIGGLYQVNVLNTI